MTMVGAGHRSWLAEDAKVITLVPDCRVRSAARTRGIGADTIDA